MLLQPLYVVDCPPPPPLSPLWWRSTQTPWQRGGRGLAERSPLKASFRMHSRLPSASFLGNKQGA